MSQKLLCCIELTPSFLEALSDWIMLECFDRDDALSRNGRHGGHTRADGFDVNAHRAGAAHRDAAAELRTCQPCHTAETFKKHDSLGYLLKTCRSRMLKAGEKHSPRMI